MRIAITSPIVRESFIAGLAKIPAVELTWCEPEHLEQAADSADALVLPAAAYTEPLARALSQPSCRCRWIQLLSAGYEQLLHHGVPPGIDVSNAGPVWSPLVAEHAMALLLALVRQLPAVLAAQAQGQWTASIRDQMDTLIGRRLLVIGMGSIGSEVAMRAKAFGMHVTGMSRSGRAHPSADEVTTPDHLEEALGEAHAVVLAVPHTGQTAGMIGEAQFRACRKGCFIVNVGRGSAIDTAALIRALQGGLIGGAALDVTDPEPLPASSPLWLLPNAIISPHLGGGASAGYHERLVNHVVANVRARLEGRELAGRIALAGPG